MRSVTKRGNIGMRSKTIIIVSLIFAVLMIGALAVTATITRDRVTRACFEKLEYTAAHLAEELKSEMATDRMIMTAMASLIATCDAVDSDAARAVVSSFDLSDSHMEYLELLTPDDRLLDTWHKTLGNINDFGGR